MKPPFFVCAPYDELQAALSCPEICQAAREIDDRRGVMWQLARYGNGVSLHLQHYNFLSHHSTSEAEAAQGQGAFKALSGCRFAHGWRGG